MIPPPVFDNYIIPNISGGIYFFSGLLPAWGGAWFTVAFYNSRGDVLDGFPMIIFRHTFSILFSRK